MKRLWMLFGLLLAGATWSLPAAAHKPSDSYLRLVMAQENADVRGEWDIALRDLDYAIGLDADNDGRLTWDEVRNRHTAIAAYAMARLHLERGGGACDLVPGAQLIDNHTDGAYTVLAFAAHCPRTGPLAVDYRLFADVDPQHKGLASVRDGAAVRTLVLGSDTPRATVDTGAAGADSGFLAYVRHGMLHIWIGYDHILFLVSLLLPAVLVRDGRGWRAVGGMRAALEVQARQGIGGDRGVAVADFVPGQPAVVVGIEADGIVEVAQRDVPLAAHVGILMRHGQAQVGIARLVRGGRQRP